MSAPRYRMFEGRIYETDPTATSRNREATPVVVIDPEDRAQVEAHLGVLREHHRRPHPRAGVVRVTAEPWRVDHSTDTYDAWLAECQAAASNIAAMMRGEIPWPVRTSRPLTYAQQADEDRAAAVGMDRAYRCAGWDDPYGHEADRAAAASAFRESGA